MPVRVEHERRIVPGPVLFSVSGCAVISRSGFEGGFVKVFHLLFVFCLEGDVQFRHLAPMRLDPKVRVLAVVISGGFSERHILGIAERREDLCVELPRSFIVAYRNGCVGYHNLYFSSLALRDYEQRRFKVKTNRARCFP